MIIGDSSSNFKQVVDLLKQSEKKAYATVNAIYS